MDINLYTFSKKINSTARPTSPAETFSCALKDTSGIVNPTLVLKIANPSLYNYAYIPSFNRYYFIREWTYETGLWTASLEVDSLASWKTQIGSSTCYISRSATAFNGEVLDTSYPATGKTTLQQQQVTSPWNTTITSGSFVVGIAGQSTTYYIFNYEALDTFFDILFSNSYANSLVGGNWTEIFPSLKAQCNPLQYITSIMWLPFVAEGTPVTPIRVGWSAVAHVAYKVDAVSLRSEDYTFTLLRHPQASRGEYLNNAPYSNYTLFFPPFGSISLDPDVVANSTAIRATWIVDLRTGHGTLIVSGGEGLSKIMSVIHSQIGLNYQVSQVVNRGFGVGDVIAPALAVGGQMLMGNYPQAGGEAIKGVANAIGDYASSKIPSATTIGSNGGTNALVGIPALQYEFKEVVDDDVTHRGKPLCELRQINTLSGYMKVANAYIDIASTQTEKQSIISYMEGGFYYE